MTVVQHRSTCFGANVRVLSEALLGADRQEPLVGVSISVCVSLAVHIDRDLNERGWP